MESVERSPLREGSTNQLVTRFSPSKVRAIHRPQDQEQWQVQEKEQQHQSLRQSYTNQDKSRKAMPDQSVKEWQRQWRAIMATHIAYFDFVERSFVEKVKPVLDGLRTSIAPFYDKNVTLIITARSLDLSYGPQDVLTKARTAGLKIWTVEKLTRFLTHLLGRNPLAQEHTKLSTILREEKFAGPSDRDPTAKRNDMHYFKEEYLLVWDFHHQYKPTIIKDYDFKDLSEVRWWPTYTWTESHRCPFQIVQPAEKDEKMRRLKEEARLKNGAQSQTTEDEEEEEEEEEEGEEEEEVEEEEDEEEDDEDNIGGGEEKDVQQEEKSDEQDRLHEDGFKDIEKDAEDIKAKEHQEVDHVQQDTQEVIDVSEVESNKENEPCYVGQNDETVEYEPLSKRKRNETYAPNKAFKGDNVAKRLFLHEIRASGINRSNSTSATRSTMAVVEPLAHESKLAQYAAREVSGVFGTQRPSIQAANLSLAESMPPINKLQVHLDGNKKHPQLNLPVPRPDEHKSPEQQLRLENPKVSYNNQLPPVTLVPPQKQQAENALAAPRKTQRGAVGRDNMGYCENCQVTFDDFHEHVIGKVHQEFANNPAKFAQLDLFLQSLKRR